MFIVFEGIDGSGTTTQAKLLFNTLQKKRIDSVLTAEPTDGPIGSYIRTVLSGKEKISSRALQLLFFADREDHLQKKILPALKKGKIVLSDRYFLSTLAYASLSNDDEFFFQIAQFFPNPDITIFLDTPTKVALKRIDKRGEKKELFEKKELLNKITLGYQKYIQTIPEEKRLIIDGTQSIDDVAQSILEFVLQKETIHLRKDQ